MRNRITFWKGDYEICGAKEKRKEMRLNLLIINKKADSFESAFFGWFFYIN